MKNYIVGFLSAIAILVVAFSGNTMANDTLRLGFENIGEKDCHVAISFEIDGIAQQIDGNICAGQEEVIGVPGDAQNIVVHFPARGNFPPFNRIINTEDRRFILEGTNLFLIGDEFIEIAGNAFRD